MGLINGFGSLSSVQDGAAFSRHSEVADGHGHGKAPIVLPRIENIMSLHESLVTARSAVEERDDTIDVSESELHGILDTIKALEDEVSALLFDDDAGDSIEITTSEEEAAGESPANNRLVGNDPTPHKADSVGEGSNIEMTAKQPNKAPVVAKEAENTNTEMGSVGGSHTNSDDLAADPANNDKSNNGPENLPEKEIASDSKSNAPNSKDEEEDIKAEPGSIDSESGTSREDELSDPLPGPGIFKEKVMVETDTLTFTLDEIDSTTTMTTTMTTTVTVRATTKPTPAAEAAKMKAGDVQGAKFIEQPGSPTTSSALKVTTPAPELAKVKAAESSPPAVRSKTSAISPALFGAKIKEMGESGFTSAGTTISGGDVSVPGTTVSGRNVFASSGGTTVRGGKAVASASSPGTTISGKDVSVSLPAATASVDAPKQIAPVAAKKASDESTPLVQEALTAAPNKQFFKAAHKGEETDDAVPSIASPSGFQTVTVPKRPKGVTSDA